MTSLYDTVHVTSEKRTFKHRNTFFIKNKSKHVLKPKENSYKVRYNKDIKRKLKKYKLRHDGKEDQDVLDVSDYFVTSLIIKSPNSTEQPQSTIEEIKYLTPKNYLFKMGRQNSRSNGTKSANNSKEKPLNEESIDEESISSLNDNQLRKQTNALQLLMDSRNKVIGSNSPGKNKSIEEVETSKVIEKKELKTKRLLLLQKMAESKGSLKKIEIEEYQDKCIKRKMEKRAKKLKSMILNKKTETLKTTKKPNRVEDVGCINADAQAEASGSAEVKQTNVMKLNTLQLVNIFNECEMQINISPEKKQISKEDEVFLKKLSPSLKKKENMLSYFKKIEKESEIIPEDTEDDSLVIKVKLKAKNKTNGKNKLSLKKNTETCNNSLLTGNHNTIKIESENYSLKNPDDNEQKENLKSLVTQPIKMNESFIINEERPKRSAKRPVKYVNDSCLSSSDEEWHIFTPKKKKHNRMPSKSKIFDDETTEFPLSMEKSNNVAKEKIPKEECQKKPVKLAPIFATKIQTSLVDIDAKQKFLKSGVPEQLKKRNLKQKATYSVTTCFPVTVHILQNNQRSENFTKRMYNIPLVEISNENYMLQHSDNLCKSLINVSKVQSAKKSSTLPTRDVNTMLKNIKQLDQRFPVYRTYRLLKDKSKGELKANSYVELDNSIEIMNSVSDILSENPDQLNWTSKYKPTSSKQIIGNIESIRELRKWLVQWTENEAKNKINNKNDSDFSDFYHSDSESRESMKDTNNLLIITGPVGCGKTSGVYAVAAELAIKVLEVNASTKRTGKIMLQDLHEATQSHKVNRGTSGAENSQKSDTVIQSNLSKSKKRGRPKKFKKKLPQKYSDTKTESLSETQPSQDTTRTAISLILIDDADIVFEQDDGFCSAIVQLVQCSKRPVILITSTVSCLHLQRFLQIGKIIKMNPLLPRILGTWLDLLCLANNDICWPGLGAKFLDYFKGDMRKTINYLQFYTQTENLSDGEIVTSLDVNMNTQQIEEEKSNMSWTDQVDSEEYSDTLNSELNQIWMSFTDEMFDLAKSKHSIPLFNVWWNIPRLLNTKLSPTPSINVDKSADDINCKSLPNNSNNSKENLKELELLANAIDAISIADMFCIKSSDDACIISLPWSTAVTHSVSEHDNVENYIQAYKQSEEISHEYIRNSIMLVAKYKASGKINTMPLDFPRMMTHREKDRIVACHNNLNNCLVPSAILDKRALALDYWSSCRTICRVERSKTDNNLKRNNRFCHYLKSVNANCKSNFFDNLAASLCIKDIDELGKIEE